uniref:Mitochondrial import inner membrane translocase subunit TIM23 n=1 Tax=Zooxanthella nutricula TaxID=1333877 RepID=A0A7S2NAZ9_9DINO|mmetsp:Transcript_22711/g.68280  ORF Transcript_22711/g.68280 Transcript_22711/m.68280 type:complete len:169 (+) Transcript_22711:92-598(+)
MSDYLSSGGVQTPDILRNTPRRAEAPSSRDELYLEGYGRQFGEKMTYSVGLTYGLGIFSGGFYGAMLGVRQGGATSKLFINSVLNSSTRYGPALGNQSAIITMFYVSFHGLISWLRGEEDTGNAAAAGLLAGGFYKVAARSWQPVAKYAVVSAGVFTGLDTLVRGGHL